ncbi:MAG: hypothetical protein JNM07_01770 [Phycisphaerae bacterium]|nr:hypothetical protein [Phycisphaerae bacterium]
MRFDRLIVPGLLGTAGLCGCVRELAPADREAPEPALPATATQPALAGPRLTPRDGAPEWVDVANAHCPISPDRAVLAWRVPRENARPYRGVWIGLCCDGCPDTWDSMSEDDRRTAWASIDRTDHGR